MAIESQRKGIGHGTRASQKRTSGNQQNPLIEEEVLEALTLQVLMPNPMNVIGSQSEP